MNASSPYVVVLAGGDGNRLASLTRALYGLALPKQFAVLAGQKSLLQSTIERAATLTSLDRVLVVITAHHETIARAQLAPYPGVELVVQPRNLDTAPGMLLPLSRILARTSSAHVMFLPSDHYFADQGPVVAALQATTDRQLGDRLTMLGVMPDGPEIDYGWIVRGHQIANTNAYDIHHFEEKPAPHVAEALWRSGGLWNTFIQAGPIHVFWDLARKQLPTHTEMLERYAVAIGGYDEGGALEAAYQVMTPANFSRDVLSRADQLSVIQVEHSGWSDWGSPQRVFASLSGTPCHDRLVERIAGNLAHAS